MAFSCGFFNSKGLDRTYTAEDFTAYLSSIICNGILDTYGQNFKLTAANSGLGVVLGTGKAWINGHYFINDSRYVIDLTSYQDESLPRYVGIAIYLDTTESVRSVTLKLFPGTPAENPQLPSIPQDEDHVRLLMYAVRMNPGASRITESDWFDYREDSNVCGYCKCILGKCKVTDLMAQMAQLIAEVQENNETIAELTNPIPEKVNAPCPHNCAFYISMITENRRYAMEQQKIIDEVNYHKAQAITESLYKSGLISFDEYDKLTQLNRQSFSPLFVDLLPKMLDLSGSQS